MTSTIYEPELSKWAAERLGYLSTQIAGATCAAKLWERLLPLDRQRLGGDLKAARERWPSNVALWIELRGVNPYRAVLDVAKKIDCLTQEDYESLLVEIGESVDVDEAIRMAVAGGGLVVVERPRAAYWKGEEVEVDFAKYGEPWAFLWELARHGKAGQPVDRDTFNGSAGTVAKLKHRLTKMPEFPVDLNDSIEVVGRGTQQLQLPREQIRVFELKGLEALGEWFP
ncbi:MAG: hypothetical protein H6822_12940 [Planctomycetaceae bacterium]|nr:hypothetical protein [Planctomycetaceae bacterium]MCB9923083.1 hypothetical protein [Planctomycetaceae bacterium]